MRNPFSSPLWSNNAFVRVWTAASISIFGSLITRIALPLVAILTLDAGPIEVAVLRGMDLAVALIVGLVAGAWVDRLRRRPVLIWADLGRAALLLVIPVSFMLGTLALWQLLVVAALTAVLTTFFDAADNAYLPTIVERERLLEANSALAASGSVAEFAGFGISGILVQLLTGPITIVINAVTYLVSAVLLLTVRHVEAPPPPREDREPVLDEIRQGLRLVRHNPVLRAFAGAQMLMSMLWGIFGATWFLFAIDELGVGPALVGIVAGVGGASSFIGAIVATRSTRRWGIGPVAIAAMLLAALGNLFIPLAPAGLPLIAVACLVAQQLIARLRDHGLRRDRNVRAPGTRRGPGARPRRVDVPGRCPREPSSWRPSAPGLLAEVIGLRATSLLAPLGGLLAGAILYWSPVRNLIELPVTDHRSAAQMALDAERDQPVGA